MQLVNDRRRVRLPLRFDRFREGALLSLIAIALFGSIIVSCDESGNPDRESGTLKLAVTIPPQTFLVKRLGGELVDVIVLIGPGQSPHAYEPTPLQMVELGRASVYFQVGLGIENRILSKLTASHPRLAIVDTRQGIELRRWEGHDHEHEHEQAQDADHGAEDRSYDPHTWLSPLLMKQQARSMGDALKRLDPRHELEYERNLVTLERELDELHRKIQKLLAPHRGKAFFVFHPAFGYFADAYGLRQIAIEVDGKEPSSKELARLIDQAKDLGAKTILVERQSGHRGAEAVAEAIGGSIVKVDPMSENYQEELEHIATVVAEAARHQEGSRDDHAQPIGD